ncbi:MAG: WGR domain-containing protein [Sandaracinus sp.]|nr:WGR domain-containing protein [Sandaracinus sp.]MCB9611193.1 WGR domain-containing protein [Sandaracinus sp.]MCB9621055.1 WGR domain-containing protein [Sandaracinus sp.]MCB9623720.1 WGR domain-containing protein [Sandaracinus sp.]MCB9630881.1 WGR domain-containing protein [Sandaracinus sp.]
MRFERVKDGRREVVELETRGRELAMRRVTTFGTEDELDGALEAAKAEVLADGFVIFGEAREVSFDAASSSATSSSAASSSAAASSATSSSAASSSATSSSATSSSAASSSAASSSATPSSTAASSTASASRRFELDDGKSSKFWEIALDGCEVTTRWGRLGTSGQSKTKAFATEAKAQAEHDKLVAEKTGKGYAET